MTRSLLRTLTLGLWLSLAGCGYRTGLRMPEGHSRVGIEIFANDTKLPDLERQMQASMTRALRDRTGAELVRPSQASSVIQGRILNYRRRGGVRTNFNEWIEAGVVIEAEASLVDAASGQRLARTRSIKRVGFAFGIDGGEEGAAQRAIDNLAEGLILELFVIAERKAEGRRDRPRRGTESDSEPEKEAEAAEEEPSSVPNS